MTDDQSTRPPVRPPAAPPQQVTRDDDATTLRGRSPAWVPPSPASRPGRKPHSKRLVLIGIACVVAVALGVGGGALLATYGGRAAASQTPSPPAKATDPASAVRGFLQALARGDAGAALAYGQTQPADASYLNADILATALKANPITEINVPPVPTSSDQTPTIEASYKIGSERITGRFDTVLVGDIYQLKKTTSDLDVASLRSARVPLVISGQTVDSDTVTVLPGAYLVTSGLTYLDWGPDNTLLIKEPDSFVPTSDLQETITDAGVTAFTQAVKASLTGCLKIKSNQPSGCPFKYTTTGYKIDPKTVIWSLTEDPMTGFDPTLSSTKPGVGTGSLSLNLQMKATATSTYDHKKQIINQAVFSSATVSADLTKDSVTVTWT